MKLGRIRPRVVGTPSIVRGQSSRRGIIAYECLRWGLMKKSAFDEATSAGINSIARYLSGLIDMRHRRQRPRMDLKWT